MGSYSLFFIEVDSYTCYFVSFLFSIFTGASIEQGSSTPLMEAAQEGHVDLVKFLLEQGTVLCYI